MKPDANSGTAQQVGPDAVQTDRHPQQPAAALAARQVFKLVWKHATPGENADAPKPLESQCQWREILVAAAVQGAIFSFAKAVTERGGARAFQKWTGDWPGN